MPSQALRLYQITDTPGAYFSDKKLAKAKRQELNGDESDGRNLRYVVSPGPDHRNYKA